MSLRIKRGDTFSYYATFVDENEEPMDISKNNIRCQIRDSRYNLITDVTIAETETPNIFHLGCNTDNFPSNIWGDVKLLMDIELRIEGNVISSDTLEILVEKDVTFDEF